MFKQLGQRFAPGTVVRRGQRVRLGTLDNVPDGTGAVCGACMWIGVAVVRWLL